MDPVVPPDKMYEGLVDGAGLLGFEPNKSKDYNCI